METIANISEVQESIAKIVNDLSKKIISEEKAFRFTIIGSDNESFELIRNIISNFKEICQTPKDNKKLLLLELFECYFMDEKSFKNINTDDINDFNDMMQNYDNFFNTWLKFTNMKFMESEEAKKFVNLLNKIPELDKFFVNIGIRLLMKKGYTSENLLKYTIYTLTYKNNFYHDINSLIQDTKKLSYINIADKLMSLIDKINSTKDLENMKLIYSESENSFELVPVDINVLLEDFIVHENTFPKYLSKRINKYINNKNELLKNGNDKEIKKEDEPKRIEQINKKFEDNKNFNEKDKEECNKINISKEINKNSDKENIEDNKYNELMKLISGLKNEIIELKNTNTKLEKELSDKNEEYEEFKENTTTKIKELSDKNEEYEEFKENTTAKIKNLTNENKNEKNIIKLKIQKINNIEEKIKKLESSNKEINNALESIKNRDLCKAIVDYINGLLYIKTTEKYPIRIKNIIAKIEQYICDNKISSPNNFEKLITFLQDISTRITDSNDKAHILDPDSIEDKYILKIFPKYKEIVAILFKVSFVEGIKNIIKKKIAINKENYDSIKICDDEINKLVKDNSKNFYPMLM